MASKKKMHIPTLSTGMTVAVTYRDIQGNRIDEPEVILTPDLPNAPNVSVQLSKRLLVYLIRKIDDSPREVLCLNP